MTPIFSPANHRKIFLVFLGMAFYKCKDCGKELIGKTELKYDPLDEIFIQKGVTSND